MIYNTVRDNKYLEKAIDVFDDKYEVAAEPVREDESKTKYYRPPKKKTAEDTPQEPGKARSDGRVDAQSSRLYGRTRHYGPCGFFIRFGQARENAQEIRARNVTDKKGKNLTCDKNADVCKCLQRGQN